MSQTHENWRAIILDDGDATGTREVVRAVGDSRIRHSPNRERLGGPRNIVQAFSRRPMAGGKYFYVLEDDNLILPTFIEQNLRRLSQFDVGVVVNNQWVEVPSSDPQTSSPKHDVWTTIDCFTEGVWSADDFKVAMLWRTPISNGSIFWRLDCRSDFSVGHENHPGIHEELRAYGVDDAVYFSETPNAFWYPSPAAADQSISAKWVYLRRERTIQAMRRSILDRLRHRGDLGKVLSERYKTPLALREEGLVKALGRWPAPSQLTLSRRAALLTKALVLRTIVPAFHFDDLAGRRAKA